MQDGARPHRTADVFEDNLKSKVWQTSPTNLPEHKTAITTAVDTIDSEACSRVMVGFQNCLTAILVKDGGHFEPLYH
ncbi:hypothetical protein NPIL_408111 [Nephila pilipes]|uniref:Uncharacterized protein n=1 Tax=Nephila pilipes TaxID=299642 RepID=A0A8X6QNL2_NEPPI|nr:hypothetical protein NPIL_408111 [Nephila pilipes]